MSNFTLCMRTWCQKVHQVRNFAWHQSRGCSFVKKQTRTRSHFSFLVAAGVCLVFISFIFFSTRQEVLERKHTMSAQGKLIITDTERFATMLGLGHRITDTFLTQLFLYCHCLSSAITEYLLHLCLPEFEPTHLLGRQLCHSPYTSYLLSRQNHILIFNKCRKPWPSH